MRAPSTRPVSRALTAAQVLLALAPAVALAVAWGQLPDTVPAHWGAAGVDRWGSKLEMLAVPAAALVLGAVFLAGTRLADPERPVSLLSLELNERAVVAVSGCAVDLVLLAGTVGWILAAGDPAAVGGEPAALNWQVLGVPLVCTAAGALLTLRSSGMPEDDPLLGEQYRAHRISGAVLALAGVVMGVLCAFVLSGTAVQVCQAVIAAVAMAFVFVLLRRWL